MKNTSLYDLLNKMGISYDEVEHPEVFTVEEAQAVKKLIDGTGCKNLLLKDKNSRCCLYILHERKRADLKSVANAIGSSRLSFADEKTLFELLGLEQGAVSPFGIINDTGNRVILLIDSELKGKTLLFHPNVNTKTISVKYDDLIRFIEKMNHRYIII